MILFHSSVFILSYVGLIIMYRHVKISKHAGIFVHKLTMCAEDMIPTFDTPEFKKK